MDKRAQLITCPDCLGTGARMVNTGLMPEHGNLELWSCDRCGGEGKVVESIQKELERLRALVQAPQVPRALREYGHNLSGFLGKTKSLEEATAMEQAVQRYLDLADQFETAANNEGTQGK